MFSPCRRLCRHLHISNLFKKTLTQTRLKSSDVKLEGLVAAPLTPFVKNGELDTRHLDRCAQYLKQTHFNGVFVTGTVGEGMTLSCAERKILAEKWRELTDETFFMIMHIGTGNYKESQELARHAEALGVDAIAALPPTYQKPQNERQLVDYLQKVGEAAPNTPLLYYDYNITTGVYLNVPKALELAHDSIPTLYGLKHTSPELPSALKCSLVCGKHRGSYMSVNVPKVLELANDSIPTLYGLKHTSPELPSALKCSLVCGGKYKVFFGTEALYLPALSLGIPDVITVPHFGDLFYGLKTAFDAGDIKEAQRLQRKVQTLVDIQQKHGGGIACAKAVFELFSGIKVGPPRLPLHGLPTETVQLLEKDLTEAGFL